MYGALRVSSALDVTRPLGSPVHLRSGGAQHTTTSKNTVSDIITLALQHRDQQFLASRGRYQPPSERNHVPNSSTMDHSLWTLDKGGKGVCE